MKYLWLVLIGHTHGFYFLVHNTLTKSPRKHFSVGKMTIKTRFEEEDAPNFHNRFDPKTLCMSPCDTKPQAVPLDHQIRSQRHLVFVSVASLGLDLTWSSMSHKGHENEQKELHSRRNTNGLINITRCS